MKSKSQSKNLPELSAISRKDSDNYSLSDLEPMSYFSKNANMHILYSKNDKNVLMKYVQSGHDFAIGFITKTLDQVDKIIFDKEIERKFNPFCIQRSMYLSHQVQVQEQIIHDEEIISLKEQDEPLPSIVDKWHRYNMEIQTIVVQPDIQLDFEKESIQKKSMRKLDLKTPRMLKVSNYSNNSSSLKSGLGNLRTPARTMQQLTENFQEIKEEFKTIKLWENLINDHEIEEERDKQKIFKEKVKAQRLQEKKDQMIKMRTLFGDQQIGFDYDGKLMKVVQPRADRFPTNEVTPTHEIVDLGLSKKMHANQFNKQSVIQFVDEERVTNSSQSQKTNLQIREQDQYIDQLKLQKGVNLLKYGNLVKEGPDQGQITDIQNIKKLLKSNNKVCLTKKQYNIIKNDQLFENSYKQRSITEHQQSALVIENQKGTINQFDQDFENQRQKKLEYNRKINGNIVFNMTDNQKQEYICDITHSSELQPEDLYQLRAKRVQTVNQATVNDQISTHNQQKQKNQVLPQIFNQRKNLQNLNLSLGNLHKLPRNRISNQALSTRNLSSKNIKTELISDR